MIDVIVYVVSFNRPHLLKKSIYSLADCLEDVEYKIVVIDNGSDEMTREIIDKNECIHEVHLLDKNIGFNLALDKVVAKDVESKYILISDHDMLYQKKISRGINVLESCSKIGAVSFQNSPEHGGIIEDDIPDGFILKNHERACSLLIKNEYFQSIRPLPSSLILDRWIMQDSEKSLSKIGKKVAVLPLGSIHLGWQFENSTWQLSDMPEFKENKKLYEYKKSYN